jgi:acetyl esterase/lipase
MAADVDSHAPAPLHGRTFYLDRPIVAGRVWDLFAPPHGDADAAIFFVHGGGWRSGTRSIFHPIIEPLVARNIVCASCDYRLNDVTIADQIADVREAYAQFIAYLSRNGKTTRPIVFGSSAGAHLALILALAQPGACGETLPNDAALRDYAHVLPAGAAVVSAPLTCEPWDEIVPAIWNDIRRIVAVDHVEDPQAYRRVSPIEHIRDDAPPVLLMQAANEDMFPQSLTDAFVSKMRSFGRQVDCIEYANAEHGFFYDVIRPCQQHALRDLLTFIQQHGTMADNTHAYERNTTAM